MNASTEFRVSSYEYQVFEGARLQARHSVLFNFVILSERSESKDPYSPQASSSLHAYHPERGPAFL
jgi:hypothetical protein